MASSLNEHIIGVIIKPITRPALKALKIIRLGIRDCNWGVTKVRAKYPYTTVGIPASISRMGLSMLRNLGGAYSERKIAISNPIGTANPSAITETRIVPISNGSTPKS